MTTLPDDVRDMTDEQLKAEVTRLNDTVQRASEMRIAGDMVREQLANKEKPSKQRGDEMKHETVAIFILFALLTGLAIGELFPRHNYRAVVTLNGTTIVLVDTTTGKVCSPTRNAIDKQDTEQLIDDLEKNHASDADPVKSGHDLITRSQKLDRLYGPPCP